MTSENPISALAVYLGSDGEFTKLYYAGIVALNLFRAQKCSARAKVYRGGIRGQGSFRGMAYDKKQWSMKCLCEQLEKSAGELGIVWGWKEDPIAEQSGDPNSWVLYVELPNGQVSFHSPSRGVGPDFAGEWDRQRQSQERIIAFCDLVYANSAA